MFVFTKYGWLGASSRVRFFKYLSLGLFSKNDLKINILFDDYYVNNLYSKKKKSTSKILLRYLIRFMCFFYVLFNFKIRVVWVEKELFPYIPIPFEFLFTLFRKKVVYDFDDAIFHNYEKNKLNFLFRIKFKIMMRYSSLVFVGNEYLLDNIRTMGANNIKIIPTVIDLQSYENEFINYQILNHQPSEKIIIGWIGSPSTQKYLFLVDDVVKLLQSELDVDIQFNIIGANNNLNLQSNFKIISWKEETEINNLLDIDIGIMPLFDSSFERGKCGYKIIQYYACRKPVLASPVGVNRHIVKHGNNGFLCNNKDDWYHYMKVLILDNKLRKSFAKNGYELVKEKYTYQVQYLNIIKELESIK